MPMNRSKTCAGCQEGFIMRLFRNAINAESHLMSSLKDALEILERTSVQELGRHVCIEDTGRLSGPHSVDRAQCILAVRCTAEALNARKPIPATSACMQRHILGAQSSSLALKMQNTNIKSWTY